MSRADLNLDGNWEVARFLEDGVDDRTSDYAGMVFNFNGSVITVTLNGNVLTSGSCDDSRVDHDGDGEDSFALDIVFNGQPPFRDLEEEWVVLDGGDDLIKLTEGVSIQAPEKLDLRRI